jgi:hypothetical protein
MKKAQGLSLNVIVIAIISLVVLIVLLAVFTNIFRKEAGTANRKVDCLNTDTDGDGVMDIFDQCCETGGDVELNGCPPDEEKSPCTC